MQRCRNALRCCNYEDMFSFVPKREPEKKAASFEARGTNQGLLAPNNPIYVCYTEKFGRFTHSREDLCPNFPASLICCFAADVMLL